MYDDPAPELAKPSPPIGNETTRTGYRNLIAFGGLGPLLVAAPIAWSSAGDMRMLMIEASLHYSAVLLSFMGGIRWGAEIARAPDAPSLTRLGFGVLAPVIAWISLYLVEQRWVCAILLMLAALGQSAWDWQSARKGLLPRWLGDMRLWLSLSGSALLAIVLASNFAA